ncbi:hypothetical protein SH611_05080 [Geminicoccaceae bacterium 1502E]|nr:hypothetical protein [Geminicoccaceae bacterium 1502E]
MLRRLLCVSWYAAWPALVLLLVAGTGRAAAQGADQVTIELRGEIEKSCALSAATSQIDLGDLTKTGAGASVAVGVSCNAPFAYELSSANGGLRHQSPGDSPPGFTGLLPYEASLTLPLDDGSRIDDRCTSTVIGPGGAGCAFSDSGTAIALDQSATLAIDWSAPALPLLAGSYADELTLSVAVLP